MIEDKRTTYIEFYGKSYPLCLTIAAQEKAKDEFGGISKMLKEMRSSGDNTVIVTANLIHILMCGGRDRTKALAWMASEQADVPEVPDREMLKNLLTIKDVSEYQQAIFETIHASAAPTVETAPEKQKNADTTQG